MTLEEKEKTVSLHREKIMRTIKVKRPLVVYFVNANTGVIRVSLVQLQLKRRLTLVKASCVSIMGAQDTGPDIVVAEVATIPVCTILMTQRMVTQYLHVIQTQTKR